MVEEYKEFLDLRRWFLEQLKKVDMSNGCKSYEGAFELFVSYPDVFEYWKDEIKDESDFVKITLHCYVVGPNRHYDWTGKNIHEAVVKCRKDLEQWCKEDIEDN